MSINTFRFPTNIIFGSDSIKQLADILKEQKITKPLLVTDKSLEKMDFISDICRDLQSHQIAVQIFAESYGNPVKTFVSQGVDEYKKNSCDGIVMCGGGCALDVGKAIALMVHHQGDLFDYEDGKIDAREVDQPIPFMVAIPTTAGTGSEVGGSSVISDDQTHSKVIIWSPRLIPNKVIADPQLTISLPPQITAATGMDALTHNIEAYLAKNFHPICDGIALEGIRLCFENLKSAYSQPDNIQARSGMLMASMMGAIAFQKGLGVTHSCAHALSTCFDVHHGLANAVMINACMKFNYQGSKEKFTRMGQCIGLTGNADQVGLEFINRIDSLKKSLGIHSIENIEVNEKLIETAYQDACHENNPRKCSKDDFKKIYLETFQGK